MQMDVPAKDLVAGKTVSQVRKLLQGIFRFAVDREYLDASPAVDLNLKPELSNKRAAYSKKQVIAMLNVVDGYEGKHEWKKWVVIIAAYTGARSGEILQLRSEDIKTDEDTGIYYMLIDPEAGSIKTLNAFRTVPIHSKLIDYGFLDFVSGKNGRLFPSDKTSKTVSGWFPRFKKSLSIPDKNEYGEDLVFHSWRHTVVTQLRGSGANDPQVQQIVGHEKTGAGITDRYTHRFPLPLLKPIVEKINYDLG
jgi:integrase